MRIICLEGKVHVDPQEGCLLCELKKVFDEIWACADANNLVHLAAISKIRDRYDLKVQELKHED